MPGSVSFGCCNSLSTASTKPFFITFLFIDMDASTVNASWGYHLGKLFITKGAEEIVYVMGSKFMSWCKG